MTEVINFFFSLISSVWQVIKSQWIISIFVLISIFGFIVDLIIKSREK